MATITRSSSSRRKPAEPKATQRLDIQGLRMVAVMLVVFSHLFHFPRGGFIGVDVFFVISGFLITGSLLHTFEKTGRISFSSFYRRRIRRIVPAATLVLVVTVIAAYFIYTGSRFKSTGLDALAAFFFVSNWRFGIEGTDYFNSSGPVSPLQHYWSLSVEEQFYFVWPAVILAIGVVVMRNAWSAKARLALSAGVMGAAVLVSFGYSLLNTASSPTWAYFSTLTRVWELGVGALLAISISYFERIPDKARPFIAWAGLIAIAVSAFVITETGGGFPAPWAAVPVLGAAMVIAAGVAGEQKYLQVLTNRVSNHIGDISYSLYLWHWPIIILLAALIKPEGTLYYAGALFLMFGISIPSYHFFENKIRESNWLSNDSEKRERNLLDLSRWRLKNLRMSESSQTIGTLSLVVIVAGFSLVALAATAPKPVNSYATPYTSAATQAQQLTGRAKDIQDAVNSIEWPSNLSPSLDDLTNARPPEEKDKCGSSPLSADQCRYGSGDKLAVVVGDSIALTWLPGVRAALENDGWTIRGLVKPACPGALVPILREDLPNADCDTHRKWVADELQREKPDLIISSGTEGLMNEINGPLKGADAIDVWQSGSEQAFRLYKSTGARVVALSPLPGGKNMPECATKIGVPSDCTYIVSQLWYADSTAERKAAAATGAKYVDTKEWFCTKNDVCPPFVGTTTVRRDGVHITPEYSRGLATELKEALNN
ncbi:acyltransferase family protein [Rhodococcus sp. NPDC059968]|uniref:acyltransferase family protein n=1 Tax=Rhodococcus sp. NPDC059968 TaxID=3347017 RepID=UPI0036717980